MIAPKPNPDQATYPDGPPDHGLSATGSGDMPELINERSATRPLLVGAADPYEFIAEHAADAPYSSDVARVGGERPLSSSTTEKIEAGAGCRASAPAFGDHG